MCLCGRYGERDVVGLRVVAREHPSAQGHLGESCLCEHRSHRVVGEAVLPDVEPANLLLGQQGVPDPLREPVGLDGRLAEYEVRPGAQNPPVAEVCQSRPARYGSAAAASR